MVIDLLGKSLEELFTENKKRLSLKTVLMLGEYSRSGAPMDSLLLQMLSRIHFIHQKSFLHRDLKPDNFLMGLGRNDSKVYLIDFGLAKRYLSREGQHIPYKDHKVRKYFKPTESHGHSPVRVSEHTSGYRVSQEG